MDMEMAANKNKFLVPRVQITICHVAPIKINFPSFLTLMSLYKVLGVTNKATPQEIKKAFHAMAKKYHPDVNKESKAKQRFQDISHAYSVLGDETKRARYDANQRTTQYTSPVYTHTHYQTGPIQNNKAYDEFYEGMRNQYGGQTKGPYDKYDYGTRYNDFNEFKKNMRYNSEHIRNERNERSKRNLFWFSMAIFFVSVYTLQKSFLFQPHIETTREERRLLEEIERKRRS
jgi:DnaJ-class molecular chaperone